MGDVLELLVSNDFIIITVILVISITILSFYTWLRKNYIEPQKKLEKEDGKLIDEYVEKGSLPLSFEKLKISSEEFKKSIGKEYFNTLKKKFKTEGLFDDIEEVEHKYDFLILKEGKIYFNYQLYSNLTNKKIYEEIVKTIRDLQKQLKSNRYKKKLNKWKFKPNSIKRYTVSEINDIEKKRLRIDELSRLNFEKLPEEIKSRWQVKVKSKEEKLVKKNIYDVTLLYEHENFERKLLQQTEYLKKILEVIK